MWHLPLSAGHSDFEGRQLEILLMSDCAQNKARSSPDHIAEHISVLGVCMHLLLHCLLCLGCSLRVEALSLFVLHATERSICVSSLGCAPLLNA